jgi:hypothetical protein
MTYVSVDDTHVACDRFNVDAEDFETRFYEHPCVAISDKENFVRYSTESAHAMARLLSAFGTSHCDKCNSEYAGNKSIVDTGNGARVCLECLAVPSEELYTYDEDGYIVCQLDDTSELEGRGMVPCETCRKLTCYECFCRLNGRCCPSCRGPIKKNQLRLFKHPV